MDRESRYREAVLSAAKALAENKERLEGPAYHQKFLRRVFEDDFERRPNAVIRWASEDWEAFDGLRLCIAHALEHEKPIPPPIKGWLVEYLRGEARQPRKKRGRKADDGRRSRIVGEVVATSSKFDLTPTRNEASEPFSACDVVAEALTQIGEPISYEGVKSAYRKVFDKEFRERTRHLNNLRENNT